MPRLRSRLLSRSLPPALAGILAVIGLLPKVSRSQTFILTVLVALESALPLAFTVVAGLVVGSIPAAVRGGLASAAGHHTLLLLAGAALVIVATRLIVPFRSALAAALGRRVDRHLQERVMVAVGRPTGIAHLEDPATLDLIVAAQGLGTQGIRPGDGVAALASLLPSWLQVIGSAVIIATFRWWLGVAWLIFWPVVLYYLQQEYVSVGQATRGEAAILRRADYYRDVALTPVAAKEVRIWGLTSWLAGRFEATWRAVMEPAWRARRPGRSVVWLSTAAVVTADLVALGLLADAAIHGSVGLGALAIYVQAVINASAFRAFDDQNMHLAYAAVAVPSLLTLERRLEVEYPTGMADPRNVEAIRKRPPCPPSPRIGAPLPENSPANAIRFEGVRFRYPNQSTDSLAGVDLVIPAGESLAVVGANGAGKTTLIKLLCRMYDPSAGAITVDGHDLAHVDPVAWRARVGAIFQDFARYQLSARDNVAMGAPHLANDLPRLREAARRAGALDLVESLPREWDTVLSRQYEGGIDLSGGEWQRIALARAMLAVEGGARVLILDEPTANLDVRAEAELYDRFLEMTAGLTTILISHRFSTVRRAHHIVVLQEGRIAERGSHEQLVDCDGVYAYMFRLQAERFAVGAATQTGAG
jgi:ABC-type multidrug transport system fused ATPase/permease subunit